MLGVLADDHNAAFSLDNLAFFTDGLYRRSNFHNVYLLDGLFDRLCAYLFAFEMDTRLYFERHVMRPFERS